MGLLKVAAKEFQQTIILITHDSDIARWRTGSCTSRMAGS